MEYLKLLGIGIVVAGMALRLNAGLVVSIAGVATGLLAGMSLVGSGAEAGILDSIGKSFVDARVMLIFLLMLPMIGLMEDDGLRERARYLISKLASATAGRLLWIYQLIREIGGTMGIRLGGHEMMVRPLIYPMALGTAQDPGTEEENLKAACSAADNYGNFFGQNVFIGSPGVLLIYQVTANLGYNTDLFYLAVWSVPVAVLAAVLGFFQFTLMDRKIRRKNP